MNLAIVIKPSKPLALLNLVAKNLSNFCNRFFKDNSRAQISIHYKLIGN